MGQIHILPDAVINHIAAGEVVERPASVVKELVENALDAGATQITITLQNGGRDLISVLDNGSGMEPEDALLAVERHATSKLEVPEDLERIATLGFRGEALASIAAVSRLELVTGRGGTGAGFRLEMEGGQLGTTGGQGFPRGTRVSVADLFFNTPARRKFLRAPATELQHIQAQLAQCALAHRQVQFRVQHNGKPLCGWNACERLGDRVHQVLGPDVHTGLCHVQGLESALRFEGLLSLPGQARSSRRWQYLFINGRPVRHPGINHAVYQGYRTLLMKERHPAYVLELFLDPREVDVNVHPAKTEVRLRNAALVHTLLADLLHKALQEAGRRYAFGQPEGAAAAPARALGGGQSSLLPETAAWHRAPGGAWPEEQQVRDGASAEARHWLEANPGFARAFPPRPGRPPAAVLAPSGAAAPVPGLIGAAGALPGAEREPAGEGAVFHFHPVPNLQAGQAASGLEQGLASAALPEAAPSIGVLAQLHATYILAQGPEGLVLIDQHAAHERIVFEQYRAQFYGGRLSTERFLVPPTLELSAQNAILLEQYLPQWQQLGFELEPFGRNSYLVRQVPGLLSGKDVQGLVLEVLDDLALFGKSGRIEEVVNEILERVACHGAIRAGMALSRPEMESLVAQLEQLDINLYCPHGRPVWIEIARQELEKRFKRIV